MKLDSQIPVIEKRKEIEERIENEEYRQWHKPELTLIRIRQTLLGGGSGVDGGFATTTGT